MARISISLLGSVGVVADPYEQDIPAQGWSRARNIRFGEKGARSFLGHTEVMQNVEVEGSIDLTDAEGDFYSLDSAIIPPTSNHYRPFCITGWVKRPLGDVNESYLLLALANADKSEIYGVVLDASATTGQIQGYYRNTSSNVITGGVPHLDDEWTPFCVRFGSTTVQVTTAGISSVNSTISGAFEDPLTQLYGSDDGTFDPPDDITVAQFALWTGELSSAQRQAWFEGKNAFEVSAMEGASLAAYWPGRTHTGTGNDFLSDVFGDNHLELGDDPITDLDTPEVTPVPLPLPITPTWIKSFPETEDPIWLYADNNEVYAYNQGTHTNITRFTMDPGDDNYNATERWQGSVFSGIGILNNGFDIPQVWAPMSTSTPLDDLANWPEHFRCRFIKPFKAFLIAGCLADNSNFWPFRVMWSHPADPGSVPSSWDVSDPSVDAGHFDLPDTPDHVVDGLQLGDIFVVYREESTWALALTGTSSIFRNYRLSNEAGIAWKDCVVAIKHGHVVATLDDVIIHQGTPQSFQSMLDLRARKYLNSLRDEENYQACFMVSNLPEKEIWFCFPEKGASLATIAMVINLSNGQVGFRDLPNVPFADAGPVEVA